MRKFSKINSYYNFFLCNTHTITVFFNDYLKKSLTAHFTLVKV